MKKKSGVKEVILLIIALITFIASVISIYVLPETVTTILFVFETILFLIIFMGLMGSISGSDVSVADEESVNESEAFAAREEAAVADVREEETLAEKQAEPEVHSESEPAEEEKTAESITVVSAPADAAVGTGDSVAEAEAVPESEQERKETEIVREVTKLKAVLFNEALLEEKEAVDMGDVVKETLDVMDPFAKAAGIRTGYVCSGDVTYTGSKKLLVVMMKNIVDNAVKYMKRAGNMHITVSNVADDIFVVCKDDGMGIGKDELPYIFDLNFQGSNRVSGNGLGLTQARDIVNAYGGTIYAKSAPGAGMGIYIQLPGNRSGEENA